MNKFEIDHLDLYYQDFHALKEIALDIPEHEITAFIGPSGCGKSTFLKCLNRMNDLVEGCKITGQVTLDGTDIYRDLDVNLLRKRVGMVFQSFNLFNNMDVLDNCTLAPVTLKKMSKAEAEKVALEHLASVGLEKFAHAAVGRLSGGQKQRMSIARAVIRNPAQARCRRHDHGRRHARDGLCPHRVRSRGLYGQGRGPRGRRAGRALRQPQAPAHPRVSLALSRGQITNRKCLRGRAAPVGRPSSSQSKGCHGRGLALLCA